MTDVISRFIISNLLLLLFIILTYEDKCTEKIIKFN